MIGQGTLKSYMLGFVVSLILTLAAYFLANSAMFLRPALNLSVALIVIVQAWVFLYLYLELGRESKPHWNTMVFLFMILVTVIIVIGSMWIMHHLNYNLMMKS